MQRTMNRGFYSFKAKETDKWIDAMWQSHLPGVFWGQEAVTDPGQARVMSNLSSNTKTCNTFLQAKKTWKAA